MAQTSETKYPTRAKLLADIDEFIAKHKMAPTVFSKLVAKDPTFLMRLRGGTSIGIDRFDEVREAMANYKPEVSAK